MSNTGWTSGTGKAANIGHACSSQIQAWPQYLNTWWLPFSTEAQYCAHIGSAAVAHMLAGDELHGNLSAHTKNGLIRFGHRAAVAKQLGSAQAYHDRSSLALVCDRGSEDSASTTVHPFQSHAVSGLEIKFDATNQEAIGKHKLHVCLATSSFAAQRHSMGDLDEVSVRTITTACDLQVVHSGSGHETYRMITKELESIGCPSWEQEAATPSPGHLSLYVLGLGKGPDNVGMTACLRHHLRQSCSVMFMSSWCQIHQSHLIVKSMLLSMGASGWASEWPVNYYSGVAIIANLWRGTGMSPKIRDNAATLWSGIIAASYFTKLLGRPLRGRWGSTDSIEGILRAASPYIRKVCSAVLGQTEPSSSDKAASSFTCLGADEDKEYQQTQGQYRETAGKLVAQPTYLAAVSISFIAKSPLMHFLFWGQKVIKDAKTHAKEANSRGRAYLGPTPLSTLAAYKAQDIYDKICNLLGCAAEGDASRWGPVRGHLQGESARTQGRELVVVMVLKCSASWSYRMIQPSKAFPLLLPLMVERPAGEADTQRQLIAEALLDASPFCIDAVHFYIAIKVKQIFAAELQETRCSGQCLLNLFNCLLLFRARLPLETQDIEGISSVIQGISRRGPLLQIALGSARVAVKKGDGITVSECCGLRDQVVQHMASPSYLERFQDAPVKGAAVAAKPFACKRKGTLSKKAALGYVKSLAEELVIDARRVWSMVGPVKEGAGKAFVVAWSFYATRFVAKGTIVTVSGTTTFTLNQPLAFAPHIDIIADTMDSLGVGMGQGKRRRKDTVVQFWKIPAAWLTLQTCKLDVGSQELTRLQYHTPV